MNFKPEFEKKHLHEANYESIVKYMVSVNHMVIFKPEQRIQDAIAIILEKKMTSSASTSA